MHVPQTPIEGTAGQVQFPVGQDTGMSETFDDNMPVYIAAKVNKSGDTVVSWTPALQLSYCVLLGIAPARSPNGAPDFIRTWVMTKFCTRVLNNNDRAVIAASMNSRSLDDVSVLLILTCKSVHFSGIPQPNLPEELETTQPASRRIVESFEVSECSLWSAVCSRSSAILRRQKPTPFSLTNRCHDGKHQACSCTRCSQCDHTVQRETSVRPRRYWTVLKSQQDANNSKHKCCCETRHEKLQFPPREP
jgi:hypothetical protein